MVGNLNHWIVSPIRNLEPAPEAHESTKEYLEKRQALASAAAKNPLVPIVLHMQEVVVLVVVVVLLHLCIKKNYKII